MKKTIKLIAVLFLAASFTGCLKDEPVTDFSTISPVVELPYKGLEGFSKDAVLTAGVADPIVKTFVVNLASKNVLDKAVTVTLGVDDAARTKYNSLGGVQYELLPDSTYSFTEKSVTIEAGTRLDTIAVTFYPEKVDPSVNYMLPISITDASGLTISGNFGTVYYHMIGNPLAGNYNWAWTRYNSSTPTTTPTSASFTFADGVTTTMLPVDPTTVEVQSGYGDQNGVNIRYQLSFTNTGGVLSNFSVRIKPSDVTDGLIGTIGVLSYTEATIISADAATRHFKFTYAVVNGAGAPRYFIDEFQY